MVMVFMQWLSWLCTGAFTETCSGPLILLTAHEDDSVQPPVAFEIEPKGMTAFIHPRAKVHWIEQSI